MRAWESIQIVAAVAAGGVVGAVFTWLTQHWKRQRALFRMTGIIAELKKRLSVAADEQAVSLKQIAALQSSLAEQKQKQKQSSGTNAGRRVTDLPDIAEMREPFSTSKPRHDPLGFEDT